MGAGRECRVRYALHGGFGIGAIGGEERGVKDAEADFRSVYSATRAGHSAYQHVSTPAVEITTILAHTSQPWTRFFVDFPSYHRSPPTMKKPSVERMKMRSSIAEVNILSTLPRSICADS